MGWWSGKRVLVTGGTGFVGRHLLDRLEHAGAELSVVTRAPNSARKKAGPARRFVPCDLHCQDDVMAAVKRVQPEVVFHLAAYYGGLGITMAEPGTIYAQNMRMGLNVVEACALNDVGKLVFCGTACSYPGDLPPEPMRETDFWGGQVHGSVEGYGVAKKSLESAARSFRREFGLSSIHVVPANLYGPHDDYGEYRSHVVAALIAKAVKAAHDGTPMTVWGTGAAVREFMYVDDCAQGLMLAAERYGIDDLPLNLGTGVGTSVRELVDLVTEIVGVEVEWDSSKPDGAPHKVLNTERMREFLGWSPPTDLRAGLQATIHWYRTAR